jgi:CxxC motif-containing protein (DUF1111 family)
MSSMSRRVLKHSIPLAGAVWLLAATVASQGITEAPAGFDDLTNGYLSQADFDQARDVFGEEKFKEDGLGPVYNAGGCGQCHANPVNGAISQVTNLRAGHFNGVSFVDHTGGSLISDRAINANVQERVLGGNEVRTFRTALNTLGAGFIEAIDSNTLVAISNSQPAAMRGQFIQVPVFEAGNAMRGGRFGWKNQNASLISVAADEYLNQIGITSPLQPVDNTSNGHVVNDGIADPESDGSDVEMFAAFMRSTKAPPRDTALAATLDAQVGSSLFNAIGCNICHVRDINTAPPGTVINGGEFVVPAALGNKRIHPFSDFLLHNVGTGDGIVQNGGQSTRNKLRTPPLWGMRSRDRLMHDGNTVNRNEAIIRHAGEATGVINNYRALSTTQQNQLITFLNSL